MRGAWKEDGLPDAVILTMPDMQDLELFITQGIRKDAFRKFNDALLEHSLSNSHYDCEFLTAMELAIKLLKEATE